MQLALARFQTGMRLLQTAAITRVTCTIVHLPAELASYLTNKRDGIMGLHLDPCPLIKVTHWLSGGINRPDMKYKLRWTGTKGTAPPGKPPRSSFFWLTEGTGTGPSNSIRVVQSWDGKLEHRGSGY